MPTRIITVALVLFALAAACGDDEPTVGEQRADQARQAALDAGLPDDVADFLALAASNVDATYQVTYPSSEATDDVVVASSPPNLRVDVMRGDTVVRTDVATADGSFRCDRDSADAPLQCDESALRPSAPNAFDDDAIAALVASLEAGLEDFTFEVSTDSILGVPATCLTTEVRADRARPELAPAATMCVSDEGVLLRLDRAGDVLEASQYSTSLADNTFARPDAGPG